jgi:hypothetical protein
LHRFAVILEALGERVRAAAIWESLVADSRADAHPRSQASVAIAQLSLSEVEIVELGALSVTTTVETTIAELVAEAEPPAQVLQTQLGRITGPSRV